MCIGYPCCIKGSPKLSSLKQQLLSLIVPEGQEIWSGSAGSLWVRVCHAVADRPTARAVITRRLGLGALLPGSLRWLLAGGESYSPGLHTAAHGSAAGFPSNQ